MEKYVWHGGSSAKGLTPVTQVYGVCFKEGKVLLLREPGKKWNIPGGKPNKGESPLETLKREILEETSVTLGKAALIGYFEVRGVNEAPIYQLRYGAIIDKVLPLSPDPATGLINKREFIDPKDFVKYISYEEYRPMLTAAVHWYSKQI